MSGDWQVRKLRDVCTLINGRAYGKSELLSEGKYPVLRVGNFFTNNKWYHSNLELPSEKYCESGDLLYAWSASFGPRIWDGEKVIFHYHIWKVQPEVKLIDQRYLFYFFEWDTEQIKLDQGTGTTMIHVAKGSMEDRDVPVPSLPTQLRIVAILDEAFEGIATAKANAEKNLQNAEALFQSQLTALFNRPTQSAIRTTLGQATGGVLTGPFGSLLHKHDYVENGIPLVNPAHISHSGIEPDSKKTVSIETAKRLTNYIMRAGDIVIGRRGEMGRCALVTDAEDGWLCGTGSFFIKPSPRCDAGYLVHLLRSDQCKQQLERIAGGAVMPNLSNTDLSSFALDLPPIEDQKQIVAHIEEAKEAVERLKSIYRKKIVVLDELKKSLLHQAFNGQL